MARYRTVKPDFFTDEKLADVSRDCRLLFLGLSVFSDDMGRQRYAPKRIQLEIFPDDKDVSPQQVAAWIRQLEKAELIKTYEIDGHEYIWLPHFLRHQRIDRPHHSDIPAHPYDRRPDCLCWRCKAERNGDGESVPAGTIRRGDESSNRRIIESRRNGMEWNGEERSKSNTTPTPQQTSNENFEERPADQSESSRENRRAEKAAVEEIAMRMLKLLKLEANPTILMELTDSIRIKARSKACSLELAGQQIMARAAFVATESPPEDWLLWFRDVRYTYVPEGDSRLKERRVEARPTCGGTHCEEGYEVVQVNGVDRLRRCPECAKLWDR